MVQQYSGKVENLTFKRKVQYSIPFFRRPSIIHGGRILPECEKAVQVINLTFKNLSEQHLEMLGAGKAFSVL